MTGKGTPRRHIHSPRVSGRKLDADAAATYFRERMLFASISPTLDPSLLVKALGPNMKANGSSPNERGAESQEEEKLLLPNIDNTSKRQPGQVLKLHTSFKEIRDNPDKVHIGWVDPMDDVAPDELARRYKAAFKWKANNPTPIHFVSDSGEATDVREGNESAKALGRTLREINPSATIDLAAAIARGVIVDPDGKMRCPPGTPNANQFTDEFMTNCMTVPGVRLLRRGINQVIANIRRAETEGRMLRLQRDSSQRFQQAKENVATVEEIGDAITARHERISEVLRELGVDVGPEFNGDYVSALMKIAENGGGPEVKRLFTDGGVMPDGSPIVWDDTKSVVENLQNYERAVRSTYEDLFANQTYLAFIERLPQDRQPPTFEEFKAAMSPETKAAFARAAGIATERHQASMRGFMATFIDLYKTDPDKLFHLRQIRAFPPGDDPEGLGVWWTTDAIAFPSVPVGDGAIQELGAEILFNPYKMAMEPFMDIIYQNIKDPSEYVSRMENMASGQALAAADDVAKALDAAADAAVFVEHMSYAMDITASRNIAARPDLSYAELRAMHVGFHEFAHVIQYQHAATKVRELYDRLGYFPEYTFDKNGMPVPVPELQRKFPKNIDDWTAGDWIDAVYQVHGKYIAPGEGFPPVNAAILEESMVHLFSGKRYQDEIAKITGAPRQQRSDLSRVGSGRKEQIDVGDSRAVEKLTWDDRNKTLIVTYDGGRTYTYSGVSGEKIREIETSPEYLGRLINDVKRNYPVSSGGEHGPLPSPDMARRRSDAGMRSSDGQDIPGERLTAIKTAVNEATVELWAMKKMGVLRGDAIEQATGWLDEELPMVRNPLKIADKYTDARVTKRGGAQRFFAPIRRPNMQASPQATPQQQVVADSARRIVIAEDIKPSSGVLGSMGPTPTEARSPWSGLSDLIITDKDTGIGDPSPTSRPSERLSATTKWSDSVFGLGTEHGSGQQLSDMDPETLDRRYKAIESISAELSSRDSLDADDQARLWLSAQSMKDVLNENNSRRRMSDQERRRAEARGRKVTPGRFVSRTSSAETDDAISASMERSGADGARPALIDEDLITGIKADIGRHFNTTNGTKPSGATGYTPQVEAFGRSSRLLADSRQRQLSEQVKRQNDRIGTDGISRVISSSDESLTDRRVNRVTEPGASLVDALTESRDLRTAAGASGDKHATSIRPTPGFESASITAEVEDVLLPAMDRFDDSRLDRDIEISMDIPVESGDSLISGEIVRHGMARGSIGGQASTGETVRARVILRSGDKGIINSTDGGDADSVLIPPGSLVIADFDSDGTPIALVAKQSTSSDLASELLARLDSENIPEDIRGDAEELRKVLTGHVARARIESDTSKRPRGIDQDDSIDRSGRMKAMVVFGEIEKFGSSPLNPPERADAQSGYRSRVSSVSDRARGLVDRDIDPSSDAEIDLRERLRNLGDIDIQAELDQALADFHRSVSDQPRIELSLDETRQILFGRTDAPIFPRKSFADGSANPFAAVKDSDERLLGIPDDAPTSVRSITGYAIHDGDLARSRQYLDSLDDKLLERSPEYLEDSSEFSLRGVLGDDSSIEVILSPSAAERSSVASPQSIAGAIPAPLSNADPSDVAAALFPIHSGNKSDAEILSSIVEIIERRRSGSIDISDILARESGNGPLRSQVIGGVSRSDIESVRIPVSALELPDEDLSPNDFGFDSRDEAIRSLIGRGLSKGDAAKVFDHAVSRDTAFGPAQIMRASRAAQMAKADLDQTGIRAIITNPDGIDLTNPSTFSRIPYVKQGDSLDSILVKRNHAELLEQAPKLLEAVNSGKIESRYGSRSRTAGRGLLSGASLAGRIVDSKRGRELLRRAGVEDDDLDTVKFVGDLATGFAAGGPAGMAAVLARAAGRSGFDVAIRRAVDRGLVTAETAQKLTRAADRVAPNALPDNFEKIISDGVSRIDTDELADRARSVADSARDIVGSDDRIDRITERARGLRRRLGRGRSSYDDDFLDDPYPTTSSSIDDDFLDDPFGDPVYTPSTQTNNSFDFLEDPFGDDMDTATSESEIQISDDSQQSRRRLFGRRRRQEENQESEQTVDDDIEDPFPDDPFGLQSATSTESTSSSYDDPFGDDPFAFDPITDIDEEPPKRNARRGFLRRRQDENIITSADDEFELDDPFPDDPFTTPYRSMSGSRSRTSPAASRMRRGDSSFSSRTGSRSRTGFAGEETIDRLNEIPGIRLETDEDAALLRDSRMLLADSNNGIISSLHDTISRLSADGKLDIDLNDVFTTSLFGEEGERYIKNYNKLDELIASLPDGSPEKDQISAQRQALSALFEISRVSSDLAGASDPFGSSEPITINEARARIVEATADMGDDVFGAVLEAIDSGRAAATRRERERARKKLKLEASSKAYGLLERINSPAPPKAKRERTFPSSQTARAIAPDVDWDAIEPKEGTVRSLTELEDIASKTVAMASDLTEEERINDLADVLNSADVVAALETLANRTQSSQTLSEGQQLVSALIKARGYDSPAARLTHDEIDRLVHLASYQPISRGGSRVPQESHIANNDLMVGTGVDGAGLYFAVEDAVDSQMPTKSINHKAAIYAQEAYSGVEQKPGRVIRAVASPEAKRIDVRQLTNMTHDYMLVSQGSADPSEVKNNPLVDLRLRLINSNSERDKKLVELLDAALTSSADGEYNNPTTIAAILMGYDAVTSLSGDNRFIVLNRSAFPVASTSLSPDEWTEMASYEKLVERHTPLAKADGIPLSNVDKEFTDLVERITDDLAQEQLGPEPSASRIGSRSRTSGAVQSRMFADDFPYMDRVGLDPRPRSDEEGAQRVNTEILRGATPQEMREYEEIAKRSILDGEKRIQEIRDEIIQKLGSESDLDDLQDFERPIPQSWRDLSAEERNSIEQRIQEMQWIRSESERSAYDRIAELRSAKRSERKEKIRAAKKKARANKAQATGSKEREYKGITIPDVEDIQPDDGEYPDEVVEAARKLREQMEVGEPDLTDSLIDVADAFDGKMQGLEFRFKATKGLAKKISNYMAEGLTLEEAVAKVKDAVRYTMELDEEQYVMGLYAAIGRLRDSGHEILEIKNYWEEGDAYQGINMVVMHPDGFKYELQFHTPTSFEVKQESHGLYDDYQKETNRAKRFEIFQQMTEAASKIKIPAGNIMSIGDLRFQPFEDPEAKSLRPPVRNNSLQYKRSARYGDRTSQRQHVGRG